MSLRKFATVTILGGVAFGLVGCTATKNGARNPMDESSDGIKQVSNFYGEHMSSEEELGLLNKKTVYFQYDCSELTSADQRLLKVHAKYLLDHPKLSLRIAGHSDERGSPAYNLALGERRAKSVARYLESLGVPAKRLHTISYRKQQPVDAGSGELSWSQNRRAELEYEDCK